MRLCLLILAISGLNCVNKHICKCVNPDISFSILFVVNDVEYVVCC